MYQMRAWSLDRHPLFERLEVVVGHDLDARAEATRETGGHLHARMHLMIEKDRMIGIDENGDRRQMSEGRRRGDDHGCAENGFEQGLEFTV